MIENLFTFVRTLGNQRIEGKKFFTTQVGVLGTLSDSTGTVGTAGKVLSSTGSGVEWITVGGGSSNVADLDDLTDVVITTASSGQLLRFNGTSWANWTPNFLTAYGSLNDLSDVTLTTPLNGARLIYSSATSQWIDANPLGINKIYYGTASGDAATTNVITNGTRLSVGTLAMPTNLNVGQVDITTGIVGEGSIHIGGIADAEVYLLASRNKIQVGSQVVTFIPGEGEGDPGTTTTTFTASTLNIQPIGGQTVFGGLVTATGFKTPSGTSLGFLKADGSVDTTQYLPSGQIDLDDLSDVIITSPSSGQILRYELPLGELIPAWRNVTPGYLTPNSSIDSLVDVAISGAAVDQLLRWNGTYWINWTPNFLTSFTETDPTVPAHVKTISTTNISNWDAGYNDSIRGISFSTLTGVLTLTQMDLGTLTVDLDGRYLESYTETDPVFSASPAATIEQPSIDKWNQAYFWGDHSLVGYLTEESDTLDTVTSRGSATINAVDVGGITTPYVQFEEVEEAHGLARSINWSEDHNTLEVFYADEKHFDVGQDQMWYVKNGAEEVLIKGTVVMAVGPVGNSGKIEVAPLVADGTVSGRYAIGIVMDDIRIGEFGFVMTQGKLRGIDTGEFTEGDTLYPDPLIPGALVNVEPASPALKLPIAFVVTAAANGAIAVRMTQGLDLHEIHDVQITSPANGQILRLETGVWTNWTPSYIEAETDPVFIASPAANISAGAIDKWDTAYGWGDHSLVGYLTSFTETDPTVPAHVKLITEQNIIDWNKAYDWGNHADAGYLTTYENNYISDVRISEFIVTFTGQGNAFNGDVDFSELPFASVTHNHVIAEITGLETALAGKQPVGSYITTETDPTVPAHVKSITEQNIIDWNKAYGWGNHADYGYLTSLPTHTHAIADVTGLQTALDGKVPTTRTITINGTALDLSADRSWTISSADGYISDVRLQESTLEFTGEGSAFTGNIDLSTLPFAPQGSYLTAEADTLSTVTARGASTSNLITINSSDVGLKVQENGTSTAWRGRIGSFNSSADKSSFLGNYTGRAGVFGHNNALTAWDDLWVNTLGIYGQGNLYLSWNTYVKGNSSDTNYSIWHAGNDGSGSGLDADLLDGVQLDNVVWGNARGTNESVTTDNNSLDKTGYYTSSAFQTKPSGVSDWMYIEHIKLYNSNTRYQKQIGYDTYDDRMWVRTRNDGTWSSWKQIWTSAEFSNNSTNWNTAFGWGNHADASYIKADSLEPLTIQAETVTFTGSVTVEGTFTESSSIRFKENITPLDSALDKVKQLEAVSYNKIGVDDREIGLIAEDVAELFPDVVTYNEEGQPQGIQYQRLSVILLKAVQELSQEVNELKKKLN